VPYTTKAQPATDKQKAFIRKLIAERPDSQDVEDIRRALNQHLGSMTRTVASKAIEDLMAIPKSVAPAAQSKLVDAGYYLHDGTVYLVVASKQDQSRRYAKQLVIPTNRAARAKWEIARGAIYQLTDTEQLTVEEAAKCGHLHGYCVVCGRRLDDPKSVQQGIGPDCIKTLRGQRALAASQNKGGQVPVPSTTRPAPVKKYPCLTCGHIKHDGRHQTVEEGRACQAIKDAATAAEAVLEAERRNGLLGDMRDL
jgi:hypothetical protein